MSQQKETEKKEDLLQEKKALEELQLRNWKRLIGKLHEGISQLDAGAQAVMLRKQAESSVETILELYAGMSGRDPRTFSVDEITKMAEEIEKKLNKHYGEGESNITRKGNIITWRASAPCYDPKIEGKMIKPYPAYCDYCQKYYFESLYKTAHKGTVKVEALKSALHGDGECLTRIELL
ncbi:hypothetical protein WDW89_23320 [Deltaproteobacteria bacterium TL4]